VEFVWDQAKSDRNRIARGLPFGLAEILFENPVIEEIDSRRDYGEVRIKAIGTVAGEILACVYTDRGETRRIISLRHANRSERNAYRTAETG